MAYREIINRTLQDNAGNVLNGATVVVRHFHSGTLADIYSTRTGTTPITGSEVTADASGSVTFYVSPGVYEMTATGGGGSETQVFETMASIILKMSRSEFVADLADGRLGYLPEGARVIAGSEEYRKNAGTTSALPDLPGWEPWGDVTLEHYGCPGDDTTDCVGVWPDAVAFANAQARKIILRSGTYYFSTTPVVDKSVNVIGAHRSVGMRIDNGNAEEGLYVTASQCLFENFTLSVNSTTPIINGTGNRGTCATVGEWFPDPDSSMPAVVKDIVFRRMTMTRESTSEAGFAVAAVGRVSGIVIDDCDVIGAGDISADGAMTTLLLAHWGAHTHGVSTHSITYDAKTSPFSAGEIITGGTSGATAYLVIVEDSGSTGKLYIKNYQGEFQDNEAITGSDGGVATVNGETSTVALDYDAETAAFTAGATIIGGTSGATAFLVEVDDNGTTGTLYLNSVSGTFQDNETITGSDGGSATANGTTTADTTGNRTAIIETVQSPFPTGNFSYHPNNIEIRNCRGRNVSRLAAVSSSYAISIDGFDLYGETQGGQLIQLLAGDEADTYASPEDTGRVYKNISVRNVNMWDITGSGSSRAAIAANSQATSKQRAADLVADGNPKYRAVDWQVNVENIVWEYGARDPLDTNFQHQTWLRNLVGDFSFTNLRAIGKGQTHFDRFVLGLFMSNCQGTFGFRNCNFLGGARLDRTSQVTLDTCKIEHPEITDANGDTFAVYCTGNREITTLAAAATAGDTTITLSSGIVTRVLPGQRISYLDYEAVCDGYAYTGATSITVKPLPVGAANGTTFLIEQPTRAKLSNTELVGGDEGLEVGNYCFVEKSRGLIRGAGQYGAAVSGNGVLDIDGTEFSSNGLRTGAATRDLYSGVGGHLRARNIRFINSSPVDYNLVINSATRVADFEGLRFLGTPIVGTVNMPAILTNGEPVRFANCRDASNNLIHLDRGWTPVLERHSSGATGISLTIDAAGTRYAVNDETVDLHFKFTVATFPTGTGEYLLISGIPFPEFTGSQPIGTLAMDNGTGTLSLSSVGLYSQIDGFTGGRANEISLYRQAGSGIATINDGDITAGVLIMGQISYTRA